MTIVQPAAIAGPSLRVIMAAGKFHGVIAAVTPRFFGEPLDEGGGVDDLASALGEWLALL
jgi:hypothetical protein